MDACFPGGQVHTRQTALERQDSCTYLPHHELKSILFYFIVIIIIIIIIIIVVIIIIIIIIIIRYIQRE